MSKLMAVIIWFVLVWLCATTGAAEPWPFEVTDLRSRDRLVILVFGDGGTGEAGQYRVGQAMYQVCAERRCDLGLVLGDNLYDDGVKVTERSNADMSYREIMRQFDEKFEAAYRPFEQLDGFHFWLVLGNHDYRKGAVGASVTYSEFSRLWRMPAFHYDVPLLPDWIQIYALDTDTDERRTLNGLQVAAAKNALCAERNPDRWKLVFGHQPVYNSGHHRRDAEERRTRAMVERPVLRGCGVHVYLAGHAHHQEHLTVSGFEQIVQGAAAKSTGRNRPADDPTIRQRHFSRQYGFGVLEVDANQIRLDFYDVLNTDEKAREVTPPTSAEIVLAYSWCGDRDDTGRPERNPHACS